MALLKKLLGSGVASGAGAGEMSNPKSNDGGATSISGKATNAVATT